MILSTQILAFCFFLGIAYSDGLNPMSHPAAGDIIEAEKPYHIEWLNGTPGPVSIDLRFADTTAVLITSKTTLLRMRSNAGSVAEEYEC
jgi:hypothetical protein